MRGLRRNGDAVIQTLNDAAVWAAGYALRTNMNAVAITDGLELKNGTVFGLGHMKNLPGLRQPAMSMAGLYEGATIDAAMQALKGLTGQPITIAVDDAVGDVAYYFSGGLAPYSPVDGGEVGELAKFTLAAYGSAGDDLARGRILYNATAGSSGNGSAVQVGAVGAAEKLVGILHVTGVSGGTPSITVKIQSDDNAGFTTPTDRITFAAKTAIGFQVSQVSGAITDTYWRAVLTISGSTPSFTVALIAAIVPV